MMPHHAASLHSRLYRYSLSSSRFTKKKFEREARQKKNDMNNSNMALLAGLR
jgi:hypothetical protein